MIIPINYLSVTSFVKKHDKLERLLDQYMQNYAVADPDLVRFVHNKNYDVSAIDIQVHLHLKGTRERSAKPGY